MASFTKRNGRWTARVRKTGFPETTHTFASKASALQWSQRVESDPDKFLSQQASVDHQLVTLGDLLRKYGEEVTPRKKGRDNEKYRVKILKRSPLSGVPLKALRSHHITTFREGRLKEVSAGTVLKDLGLLSAVINTGRTEWGLENVLRTNPVSLISKPKTPRPRDRRLEEGELEKFLHFNSCSNPNAWLRPVIIFAIETGMRRGEILSLCWENVHLGKRYVHLPDTKNGDSSDVPLSPQALKLLRELPRIIKSDQVVFPLHYEALKSAWRRACERAGISDLRFHDLRHEATSRFFEKGLNVMEVAAITGHKDLRMLQRYTHLRAEKLALKLN
jgi:integrase